MKKIYSIICAALMVAGCNFLEVPIESSITTGNFFKSTADFDMALTAVYQPMGSTEWDAQHRYGSYFTGFMYWGRVGTDEAYITNGNNGEEALSMYTYTPDHLFVEKVWFMQYLGIQRANVVIDRLNACTSSEISDDDRNRILGEAHFLRGWYYFQLARYYGDVPLVLEETIDISKLDVERKPVKEVYAQIISDYEFAEQHLPVQNIVGHAHKYAATALKARAYLQMSGNPVNDKEAASKAADACREVIGSGRFALVKDYFSQFDGLHEHNSEYLFDVEFDNTANKSKYGGQVGTTDGVPHENAVYWSQVRATPTMLNKFEENDNRRNAVCRGGHIVNQGGNEVLIYDEEYESVDFIYKFRHQLGAHNRGTGWCNWCNSINFPIIRYADVLLMLAEAENRANGTPSAEALEYVNQVRRRGYEVDITTPNPAVDVKMMSGAAFDEFILEERSRELSFEGHRWADLVRFGKLKEAFKKAFDAPDWEYYENVKQYFGDDVVKDKHNIFPIPQSVIDASEGKIQQTDAWK